MLETICLSFASVFLAMSTTNQVFTGTKSPVAAGMTGLATILGFMWLTGHPVVGILIVAGLFALAIQAPE